MAGWSRADAAELIERDKMRYMGATRRSIEAALAQVDADDRVRLVAAGQMALYHPFVPAPERSIGALALCERGVALSTRSGFSFEGTLLPWEDVVRANMGLSALSGLSVEVASAERRYVFTEQFRGGCSRRHADAVAAMFQEKLRQKSVSKE